MPDKPGQLSYQPNGGLDSSMFNWTRGGADLQRQEAGNLLRADAYRDSVGFILTKDGKKPDGTDATTGGTGFFVDKNGLLATDYHVVKDNKGQITVRTADGTTHTATIVKVDPGHDLALLQVNPARPGETFIPVELAQSSTDLKPNDAVLTRGHPHRSSESILSSGYGNVTTSLDKFDLAGGLLPGEVPNRPVITSRMEVQSGDSGGPLIRKSDGKVVGIVGFTADNAQRTVSTPVEDLNRLIAQVRRNTETAAIGPNTISDLSGRSPSPYSSAIPNLRAPETAAWRLPRVPQTLTDANPVAEIAKWANIRTLPTRGY